MLAMVPNGSAGRQITAKIGLNADVVALSPKVEVGFNNITGYILLAD